MTGVQTCALPSKIVMIEFKSAGSKLSTRQRKIRNLIKEGKVDFQEIRVG